MPTCALKVGGKMAKLIDGANRYILFIQVLALLVSVCFTSPLLQLSEKPPRLLRSSEGNAVSNGVCYSERRSKGKFILYNYTIFRNASLVCVSLEPCV